MADEDLSKLKIDKSSATAPRRRRRLLYLCAAIVFTVIVVVLYVTGPLSPAVEVEVATVTQVYPSQAFSILNASGYVVAQRKAAVASKVTGRLVSLNVEEGNRVKKGDLIARLESEDLEAARDQAAANLALARSNLEQAKAELTDAASALNRNRELVAKGYIAQAEYDVSVARYDKAKAAVASAEAAIKASAATLHGAAVSLEYTFIRAPFDAVVLTKNADIGDIVTPIGAAANAKAAVVTLADMDSLQVEVDVSESNIQQVKPGQPCEIQLDALPDSRFRGEVHMIVPTADRAKASVLVKVRFLDKDIRILPEMSAKVAFLQRAVRPEEQKPRIAVNPAVIVTVKEKKVAYVVRDDRAVAVPVATGEQIGDMVEVLEGLKTGDKVISKPLQRITDGKRVTIPEK